MNYSDLRNWQLKVALGAAHVISHVVFSIDGSGEIAQTRVKNDPSHSKPAPDKAFAGVSGVTGVLLKIFTCGWVNRVFSGAFVIQYNM